MLQLKYLIFPKIIIILGLLVTSCGEVPERIVEVSRNTTARLPVSYMEVVIPPCTLNNIYGENLCTVSRPSFVRRLSVNSAPPSWPYYGEVPTTREILLGVNNFGIIPHIVVRGIANYDTTRCDVYPIELANYLGDLLSDIRESLYHYYCFIEVSINEYLIGKGPATLTVAMHRENLWDIDLENWDNTMDQILEDLDDPRSRVAGAYEGKELVLFLNIPPTLAVESWHVDSSFDIWFVQKGVDNNINVVAQDIIYARTENQRNQLTIPWTDLSRLVTEASESRISITGGRIANDPSFPLLVTDANYLQDFYVSVGAVYDGSDDATVLPPPVPGEGDVVPVTVSVGEGEGSVGSSVPVPGEEVTVPSTDDAGLTVGQESTTTTVVDTTTTTSEVVESTTTTTIAETVTGTTTTTVVPVSTTVVPSGEDNPPLVDGGASEEGQVTTTSSTVVQSSSTTSSTTTLPDGDDIDPVETSVTTVVVPDVTTTSEVVDGGASGEGQVTTTSSTVVPSVSTTSSTTTLPDGDGIGPGEDPVVVPPADDGVGSEGQVDADLAVDGG